MTIRQLIVRQKRVATAITYSGFAVFALGIILGAGEPPAAVFFAVAIPGFVVAFGATLYVMYFVRCPRCRGPIGFTVSYMSWPYSVSSKIRYCPFCGVAFDSDVDDASRT
jgi:hypothetical protein